MQRLRLLLADRPGAMAWLVACVLAMRVLIPGGYMPVATDGGIVLGLCPGVAMTAPSSHAAGMHHDRGEEHRKAPEGASMPCAFAGAGLAAPDWPAPSLDTVALAFAPPVAARVVLPRPVTSPTRWRPPLRAPPSA